jgi:hypothetical protein
MAALELYTTTLLNDADLVGYWRFEGNSSDDSPTYSNAGTDTNITYGAGTGEFGQGASFNGTTSKIVLNDQAQNHVAGNFTVGCWVKLDSADENSLAIQVYSQNTARAGFVFYAAGTSGHVTLISGKNTGTSQGTDWDQREGTIDVSDGTWHFVCGRYNGSTLDVFVDGVKDGTGTSWANNAAYAATTYERIGARNNSGSDTIAFKGILDDLWLFSRTLTDAEILGLYTQSTGNFFALL